MNCFQYYKCSFTFQKTFSRSMYCILCYFLQIRKIVVECVYFYTFLQKELNMKNRLSFLFLFFVGIVCTFDMYASEKKKSTRSSKDDIELKKVKKEKKLKEQIKKEKSKEVASTKKSRGNYSKVQPVADTQDSTPTSPVIAQKIEVINADQLAAQIADGEEPKAGEASGIEQSIITNSDDASRLPELIVEFEESVVEQAEEPIHVAAKHPILVLAQAPEVKPEVRAGLEAAVHEAQVQIMAIKDKTQQSSDAATQTQITALIKKAQQQTEELTVAVQTPTPAPIVTTEAKPEAAKQETKVAVAASQPQVTSPTAKLGFWTGFTDMGRGIYKNVHAELKEHSDTNKTFNPENASMVRRFEKALEATQYYNVPGTMAEILILAGRKFPDTCLSSLPDLNAAHKYLKSVKNERLEKFDKAVDIDVKNKLTALNALITNMQKQFTAFYTEFEKVLPKDTLLTQDTKKIEEEIIQLKAGKYNTHIVNKQFTYDDNDSDCESNSEYCKEYTDEIILKRRVHKHDMLEKTRKSMDTTQTALAEIKALVSNIPAIKSE